MSSCKITIIGLAQYMTASNNNLFKYLTLPEGIDKETLVDNIMLKGADFEVLYPNAEFFQFAIGTWSKKWQPTIEKWIKALSIEYNPLENYDRIEDWEENDNGSNTSHIESEDHGESLDKVSAFNSTSLENSGSNETDTSTISNGSGTTENKIVYKGRLHGNIGVTTSQQMLESELEIAKWNLIEQVTDLFLTEFIIPIY